MEEILFLAHRIPYPPDKGDKIRSYNILRSLAERYRVHLGCFIDNADDRRHIPILQELCEDSYFASLGKAQLAARAAGGLIGGQALSVAAYDDGAMRQWVGSVLERHEITIVYVFSSAMAQYLDGLDVSNLKTVVDFVDVDSDKWRSRSKQSKWPLNALYRREAGKLLAHDRAAAEKVDLSLFVSESEAELFRSLVPEAADKVHVVPNGLDADYFSPDTDTADPFGETPSVVFCGAMNYWPNEDAVVWYANDVHPLVRQKHPNAEFHIVGRTPGRRVLELRKLPCVNVVGTVPDVRPYLAHASTIVIPLRDSPGVANKVLEGMAMARPVVATPKALSGLSVDADKEVVVAEGATAFAAAVSTVLDGGFVGVELGVNARARVVTDYNWTSALADLPVLIEGS